MTYAVHSPNNAEILVRFMSDLNKAGLDGKDWNGENNPFSEYETVHNKQAKKEGRDIWYYTIFVENKNATYHNHHCTTSDKHFDLTEENYNEVLSEILK